MQKRFLLFFVILISGSSLLAIKGFTWDMGLPKFYFASVMISLLVVVASLKAARSTQFFRLALPQFTALLFGIYSCFTTLIVLKSLPEVFPVSLGYAMNLLLFLVFSVLIARETESKLMIMLQIFVVIGLLIAFDAIFAFYSGRSLLWGVQNDPMARGNLATVIGNVNFTTSFMAMLLFPAAFLAVSKRSLWKRDRLRKVVYLCSFSVFLIVILIGQTRSVYFSVIGSVILVLFFSLFISMRFKLKGLFSRVHTFFLIVLVMITITILWVYSSDNFLTRGSFSFAERISYTTQDRISVDSRVLQWKAAIEQWKDSKFLGTGFGTYKYFSTRNMSSVLEREPEYMYAAGLNSIRAHNEYVQVLGETGIVGIVLVILFILSMALHTFRVVLKCDSVDSILLYLFLLGGLLIIFIDSVLSFPGHLMPNALFAVFLFGFLMNESFLSGHRKRIEYGKVFSLLTVAFALITSILMSRTFISEGLFTRGYISYRKVESINPQIPELLNSVKRLRVEIDRVQDLSDEYTYLATETYVTSRLEQLTEKYPEAPLALLEDMAIQERRRSYDSIISQLNTRLKNSSNALMNARQDATEEFYNALRTLTISRELLSGQFLSDAYLGYLYLTVQRKEDYRLKISMAGEKLESSFRDIFAREDLFSQWLNADLGPISILEGVSTDHAFLKDLPEAIFISENSTDLQTILQRVDIDALIDFQLMLDAIDALLSSLRISPDLQVIRNIASLLFRVMVDARKVSSQLEMFAPVLANPADLERIIWTLNDLVYSHKGELQTLYRVAIRGNPGGWLKGNDNLYGEYARNLLLLYGEDSLDDVIEIARLEVFAWNHMKEHRGVPDGVISVLTPLKDRLEDSTIVSLFAGAREWSEETLQVVLLEIESENSEPLKQQLEALNQRLEGFALFYDMWLAKE